jgi:acetolactate synthase regulatory subunit
MTFLNADGGVHALTLLVKRELGILARIALVFSRRGLDVAELSYAEATLPGHRQVRLAFQGDAAQLASVSADLRKLIDVVTVDVAPHSKLERERPWSSRSFTSRMPIYAGSAAGRSPSSAMGAKATPMPST